jgi:hypothetical protein
VGSQLVAAALFPLAELGLSPRDRLVLVRMCLSAIDADRPPVYFGGWAALAEPLGFDTYNATAEQAVTRAVRQLVRCGVVKPIGAPGPGHNVAYELRLGLWKSFPQPVDKRPRR